MNIRPEKAKFRWIVSENNYICISISATFFTWVWTSQSIGWYIKLKWTASSSGHLFEKHFLLHACRKVTASTMTASQQNHFSSFLCIDFNLWMSYRWVYPMINNFLMLWGTLSYIRHEAFQWSAPFYSHNRMHLYHIISSCAIAQ